MELRVNYDIAINSISFSAHAVRHRLVAGTTTRRLVEPSHRRLTIQRSQVRFLLSVSPLPEPSPLLPVAQCAAGAIAVVLLPWRSPLRPSFARSEPAVSFPEPPCCSTTISPPPKAIRALPPAVCSRGDPSSALPRLQPTSGTASPRPNGAPKPSHLHPWPPERRRAGADHRRPPLSAVPPIPSTPAPTETFYRCGSTSFPFPPT